MSLLDVIVSRSEQVTETAHVYTVAIVISRAVNIPLEMFVYRVDDDTYSHIATTYDLRLYPTTSADAVEEQSGFYRKATVERSFDNRLMAENFIDAVRARLRATNAAWNGDNTPFNLTEQLTFDSEVTA